MGNITIETDGTDGDSSGNDDASNTILIKNANSNNANFTGIHIKTDSQGAANAHNDILIECDNVAAKGSTFGVDIRSENNIRIRSENNNSGQSTALLMRATGPIDLGVGDAAGVPQHTTDSRVKIHGTNGIDFAVLYRDSGDAVINTTDAKWDKIDTLHLVRAMTYKASATVARTASHPIVSAANDDNAAGTSWLITIVWKHASTDVNSQLWMCSAVGSADNTLISVKISENLESTDGTAAGTLEWTDGAGIVWTNEHSNDTGSNATMKASALRIQSGTNDF